MQLDTMYRHWIDNLWCGDFAWATTLVADDFVGHWPDDEAHGRDQLIGKIREGHAMLASLRFSIEVEPLCAGRYVAGRWRGVGYQEDVPVTLVGNDILRTDGDKFVEYWVGSMMVP